MKTGHVSIAAVWTVLVAVAWAVVIAGWLAIMALAGGCGHTTVTPGGVRAVALFGKVEVVAGDQGVATRETGGATVTDIAKARQESPGDTTVDIPVTKIRPAAPAAAADAASPQTPASSPPGSAGASNDAAAPDLSSVQWIGHVYAPTDGAVEDGARIEVSGWDADGLDVTTTPWPPEGWPRCTIIANPGEQCYAHCAIVYESGGKVAGSFFDHLCAGKAGRDFGNFRSDPAGDVHRGWDGQTEPADGTPCWFVLYSADGRKRSNAVAGIWKRKQ